MQHNYSAAEFCNHSGLWIEGIANPWHTTWNWQNICCRCKGYINKPCSTWCTVGNLSLASSVQPTFDSSCSNSPKKKPTLPSAQKTSLLFVVTPRLSHVITTDCNRCVFKTSNVYLFIVVFKLSFPCEKRLQWTTIKVFIHFSCL